MKSFFALCCSALIFASCTNSSSSPASKKDSTQVKSTSGTETGNKNRSVADAATIMARKQVPVLCYHHIRDLQMPSKSSMGYEVTAEEFRQQLKILSDSGYHTILPEQYYNYLAFGDPLPDKPVMLTYDDTDEEQFTIGKTEMDKYGFKGVYFIMTISIGRPHYMSKEQLKQLSNEGHAVESHTWDHHRLDRYKTDDIAEIGGRKKQVNDWDLQLIEPKKTIEAITGKQADYFAYPFGIWSKAGIPEIKARGIKLAFQLSTQRDADEPLYTVRRMIVSPTWSPQGLLKVMRSTFK